jgi:hypothetical protein
MWTWFEPKTWFERTPFGCGTVVRNFSGAWRAEHHERRCQVIRGDMHATSWHVVSTTGMKWGAFQSTVATMPMNFVNWSVPGDRCRPPSECRYWRMRPRAFNRVRMSVRRRTWETKLSLNSVLKPWTVPERRGRRTCGSRCNPPTSSSATVLTISVDAPGHFGSALTALHAASNSPHNGRRRRGSWTEMRQTTY